MNRLIAGSHLTPNILFLKHLKLNTTLNSRSEKMKEKKKLSANSNNYNYHLILSTPEMCFHINLPAYP